MRPPGMLCTIALLAIAGCREPAPLPDTFPPAADERRETVAHGPVRATLVISPPAVDLAFDTVLSLTLDAPADVQVELPRLAARLTGFVINGLFDETTDSGDRVQQVLHARLTPVTSEEYRVAPLVIRYTTADGGMHWLHTPALSLDPPGTGAAGPADHGAERVLQPLHIPPAPLTILALVVGALAVLLLLAGLVRLAPRLRRSIRAVQATPGDRALLELEALLAAGLVEAGRVKDFYRGLTRIVRHYIEREHRIRAPAQTTPEFLAAAVRDPRFPPDTVARLRDFLESADLVKFAGLDATPDDIANAIATTRALVAASL